EDRRTRAREASLGQLARAADEGEVFELAVRSCLDHVARTITQPEHLGDARSAILDLAVRGRLVRQDPSEGSGSQVVEMARDRDERKHRARRDSQTVTGAPFPIPK